MNVRRPDLRNMRLVLAVMLTLAAGASACTSSDGAASAEPTVTDVWARAATNLTGQDTSAIYMTIDGGGEANALLKASVPADIASSVEIHETSTADDPGSTTTMDMSGEDDTTTSAMDMGSDDGGGMTGMMQMRPVDKIQIPADGQVQLKPGGYHVMLIGLQRELQPGESVDVTLTFEQGKPITTTAKVRES